MFSASYDGTVKIYDPAQLEVDYTSGMTTSFQLEEQQVNCMSVSNHWSCQYNENVVVGSKGG